VRCAINPFVEEENAYAFSLKSENEALRLANEKLAAEITKLTQELGSYEIRLGKGDYNPATTKVLTPKEGRRKKTNGRQLTCSLATDSSHDPQPHFTGSTEELRAGALHQYAVVCPGPNSFQELLREENSTLRNKLFEIKCQLKDGTAAGMEVDPNEEEQDEAVKQESDLSRPSAAVALRIKVLQGTVHATCLSLHVG